MPVGVSPQTLRGGWDEAHDELLLDLLRTPTATPLETERPSSVRAAQERYAEAARPLGFEVVLHEAPPAGALVGPHVPEAVVEAAARMGGAFLDGQPNLLLRLGPPRAPAATLMLNVHLDTVGGELPVALAGGTFHGRGAVDMKGPAVAVLAGLRTALRARPSLPGRTTVLLQCVAGEEGGAMGVHGTRVLVEAGHVGRLNVFAEPTGGWYFDACTASATARVEVRGSGSTDDEPAEGHNATLLLGFVAAELAGPLDRAARAVRGKACVAGLHTGTTHDRVHGEGDLLVNLVYPSPAAAAELEAALEDGVRAACRAFAERFADVAIVRRTARDATEVCRVRWRKRGLPALRNSDPPLSARLAAAGLRRLPDERAAERFTCDAIWGQVPGSYTIVFGPGRLGEDGAHTPREHVARADLAAYAGDLARLVLAFDDMVGEGGT